MASTPRLGVMAFATRTTMPLPRLAERVEALGFESLFLPEHPVIPERFDSPYPGGGPLPDEYRMMVDPYVGLAAAAGATRRIRLGTSISLVLERRPLLAAKAIATLDRVSHGRVVLGVGSGWLREEGDVFNVDWERRGTQMREFMAAMKACWADGVASFDGRYVRFPEVIVEPKPVQRPHPPILVAGELALAAKRAAEWGDGWMPRYLWSTPEMVADGRRRMEEAWRERGRNPAAIDVTLFGCRRDRDEIARWGDAGVTRILFVLPMEDEAGTTARLERIAERVL